MREWPDYDVLFYWFTAHLLVPSSVEAVLGSDTVRRPHYRVTA